MRHTQVLACLVALLASSCAEAHPRNLSLVLADLHIEPPDDMGRVAGLDLDGLDTTETGTTCTAAHPDHISLFDRSETGVDNAVAAIHERWTGWTPPALSSPRPLVQEGSYLLAIQIAGVDSYEDDDAVDVVVRRVRLAGCISSGEPCRPALEGARLAAGQTFEAAGPAVVGHGTITDGRLRAELPELIVPATVFLPASDYPGFEHHLHGIRLEADVDGSGLERGTIGGALPVSELVRLLLALDPDADPAALGLPLSGFADIEPQAPRGDQCASLSVGFSMSAVRANLE